MDVQVRCAARLRSFAPVRHPDLGLQVHVFGEVEA